MKKLIIFLGVFLLATSVWAQRNHVHHLTTFDEKRVHFGFTLGIIGLDYRLEHWTPVGDNPNFDPLTASTYGIQPTDTIQSDLANISPGFRVGAVTNLRLSEYFDLRFLPSIAFGDRELVYNVEIYDVNQGTHPLDFYTIKSTYLEFPLLIKYKSSRLNNQRPYIIAGGAFRIDISKSGQEDLLQMDKTDFYFEAGVGWDSYFRFFRLSTELKVSLGLNNIIKNGTDPTQRQYYSNAIKDLRSNIFSLSFHFE